MESKGKKVFVVGGQAHNSSSYGASVDEACAAVRAVGGNTVEIPVYWENIEPKEGQFYFGDVEQIYHKVRENGLYLIVLGFGTMEKRYLQVCTVLGKTGRPPFSQGSSRKRGEDPCFIAALPGNDGGGREGFSKVNGASCHPGS